MAKAGRVQHWKHGWIPISPEAKAYAAGKGPKPVTTLAPPPAALKRAKVRQAAFQAAREKAMRPAADVKSKQVGGFRLTTVDGYPEVYFKDVVELDKRPPEQYREVAKVVSRVLKPYPRVTATGPLEIRFSDELPDGTMADTNVAAPHRIRLNTRMWDKPGGTMAAVADMKSRHWGVFAQADGLETFRSEVITHEIGHLLNMKDQDEHTWMTREGDKTSEDGQIDSLAFEAVTPRELGYTRVAESDVPIGEDPPLGTTFGRLDTPTRRWRVDSLGGRSAYATSDPYEFFAEAFLDGTINGNQATETGKRAVGRADLVFGPGSSSVRRRLYGKDA